MNIPRACPMPGCMQRLPCYMCNLQEYDMNEPDAAELRSLLTDALDFIEKWGCPEAACSGECKPECSWLALMRRSGRRG